MQHGVDHDGFILIATKSLMSGRLSEFSKAEFRLDTRLTCLDLGFSSQHRNQSFFGLDIETAHESRHEVAVTILNPYQWPLYHQ